eukprot:5476220-Pleurochrysis_carterae.AAC.1
MREIVTSSYRRPARSWRRTRDCKDYATTSLPCNHAESRLLPKKPFSHAERPRLDCIASLQLSGRARPARAHLGCCGHEHI